MSTVSNFDSLLAEINRLPVTARLQLIDAIWENVSDDELLPLSEEWMTEIQRRSAELDAGECQTIPWNDVKEAALKRLKLKPE